MESVWLEIEGNEMMTSDFAFFLEFLSVSNMEYASYYGEDGKIFMEIKGEIIDDFDSRLSQFIAYQPIIYLDEDPSVSDYDLIEEMTNME